jgi:hypothetical protein
LVWSGCPRLPWSQSKPLLHELLLLEPLLLLATLLLLEPLLLQFKLCLDLQLVWSACTLRLWLPLGECLLGYLWRGLWQGLRLRQHLRWCIRRGLRRGLRLHLHLRWCTSLGERLRLHWRQRLLWLRLGFGMRWLGLRRQCRCRWLLLPRVCWRRQWQWRWLLLPLLMMMHAPALPGLRRRGWVLPHKLLLVGRHVLLGGQWRLPVLLLLPLWQQRPRYAWRWRRHRRRPGQHRRLQLRCWLHWRWSVLLLEGWCGRPLPRRGRGLQRWRAAGRCCCLHIAELLPEAGSKCLPASFLQLRSLIRRQEEGAGLAGGPAESASAKWGGTGGFPRFRSIPRQHSTVQYSSAGDCFMVGLPLLTASLGCVPLQAWPPLLNKLNQDSPGSHLQPKDRQRQRQQQQSRCQSRYINNAD